jgi:hypothetical protein
LILQHMDSMPSASGGSTLDSVWERLPSPSISPSTIDVQTVDPTGSNFGSLNLQGTPNPGPTPSHALCCEV